MPCAAPAKPIARRFPALALGVLLAGAGASVWGAEADPHAGHHPPSAAAGPAPAPQAPSQDQTGSQRCAMMSGHGQGAADKGRMGSAGMMHGPDGMMHGADRMHCRTAPTAEAPAPKGGEHDHAAPKSGG